MDRRNRTSLMLLSAFILLGLKRPAAAASPRGQGAGSIAQMPTPPVWPESYEVSYTISLPYTQTVQPVALKYPVHIWYNATAPQLRVQFYNGVDEIFVLPDAQFYVYPRITTKSCLVINTTVGPTSRALVGDLAGMPPPLPDISDWQYAGSAQLSGRPPTHVWQLTVRAMEKVETYDFHVNQLDGRPVHLTMLGVNLLTGSHFDQYDVEFTYFAPLRYTSAFTPPRKLCDPARTHYLDPTHPSSSSSPRTAHTLLAAASQWQSLLPGAPLARSALAARSAEQAGQGAQRRGEELEASATADNLRFIHAWNQQRNQQALEQQQGGNTQDTAATTRATSSSSSSSAATAAPASPVAAADVMELAPNHFISWSDARWQHSVMGHQPPRSRQARLAARQASRAYLGPMRRRLSNAQLPSSVDWSGTGADGPVKDQASCGSCWTFATTGAMTGAWWLATNVSLSFSEQQIVDCAWDYDVNGCWGGNVEPALSYIQEHGGIASEASYPYAGQNGYCKDNATSKVAAFKGFESVPERDEYALMEAVATYGPVAISFDAVHPTFKFYSGGVYYREDCGQDLEHLNHAVTLVGYGTTPDGTDYWLLRNSWSQLWGAGGYFKMARKMNDCGVTLDAVIAVVDPDAAAQYLSSTRQAAAQ